jgi:predicted  nucleic acid-binding Zn-ribbon protein
MKTVNADPAVQRALLDLAEVDAELSRAVHRRRTLPELAEIAQAETAVQARTDDQVSARTALDDLDREVKRQEKEIDAVRAREERDRSLMAKGGLPSKQLSELEHELETLKRRQSTLEDDLLELMEQLADAQRRRDAVFADLESIEAKRAADRAGLIKRFPEPLLALYDRVRQHRGIGAALLKQRKCGACQLEVDRSAMARISASAADEVVTCDECGAIMVRTGESGL